MNKYFKFVLMLGFFGDFGTAFLVASLLMSAISVYGSIQQGQSQAKIARENARRLREQGEREKLAAKRRADALKLTRDRERRRATTAYASSGVEIGEGSPLIVEAEDDYRSEVDQATIIATGEDARRARLSQAAVANAQGIAAQNASYGQAAGQGASLLGSVYTNRADLGFG